MVALAEGAFLPIAGGACWYGRLLARQGEGTGSGPGRAIPGGLGRFRKVEKSKTTKVDVTDTHKLRLFQISVVQIAHTWTVCFRRFRLFDRLKAARCFQNSFIISIGRSSSLSTKNHEPGFGLIPAPTA